MKASEVFRNQMAERRKREKEQQTEGTGEVSPIDIRVRQNKLDRSPLSVKAASGRMEARREEERLRKERERQSIEAAKAIEASMGKTSLRSRNMKLVKPIGEEGTKGFRRNVQILEGKGTEGYESKLKALEEELKEIDSQYPLKQKEDALKNEKKRIEDDYLDYVGELQGLAERLEARDVSVLPNIFDTEEERARKKDAYEMYRAKRRPDRSVMLRTGSVVPDLDELSAANEMTVEEATVESYMRDHIGEEAARAFRDSLELYDRAGMRAAQNFNENTGSMLLGEAIYGFYNPFDSLKDAKDSLEGEKRTSVARKTAGYINEGLADKGPKILGHSLGQVAGDVIYNEANMVPSMLAAAAVTYGTAGLGAAPALANMLGQGAGALVTGVQTYGQNYQEAREEGKEHGESVRYGVVSGAMEGGLQFLLSGVGNLEGKLTGHAVKSALDKMDHVALRMAAEGLIDAGGEFTEEYLQEVLTPVIRNVCFNEKNEFKPFTEDALYSGILGAISSAAMGAPGQVINESQAVSLGKEIKGTEVETLLKEAGEQERPGSFVWRMATKDETGRAQLGLMYKELQESNPEALVEVNKAYIRLRSESAQKKNAFRQVENEESAVERTAGKEAVSGMHQEDTNYLEGYRGEEYVPFSDTATPESAEAKVNGKPVTITGVSSLRNGNMKLKTANGETVNYADVKFANEADRMVYSVAAAYNDVETAQVYIRNYGRVKDKTNYSTVLARFKNAGFKGEDFHALLKAQPNVENFKATTLNQAYMAGQSIAKRYHSEAQVKAVRKLSESLGLSVEFYDGRNGTNGYYEDGAVHINLRAENPYLVVMGHELTHDLKKSNAEGYQRLQELVVEYLQKKDPDGYEDRLNDVRNRYLMADKRTTEEDAVEEVVANACSEFLLDEEVVKDLVKREPNLAKRILEAITKFLKRIREELKGYKYDAYEAISLRQDEKVLKEAKRLWTEGLKGRQEIKRIGKVKYDLGESYESMVLDILEGKQLEDITHLYIGETPDFLSEIGLKKLPMLITKSHIYSVGVSEETARRQGHFRRNVNYHNLGKERLCNLKNMMEEYAFVIKSNTNEEDSRIVIITKETDEENCPIIIAMQPNGEGYLEMQYINANVVASMYGKRINGYLERALEEERILLMDKRRSQDLRSIPGVQFPNDIENLDFTNNVARYRENVKEKVDVRNGEKKSLRKPSGNAFLKEKHMAKAVEFLEKGLEAMYENEVFQKVDTKPMESKIREYAEKYINRYGSDYEVEELAQGMMEVLERSNDMDAENLAERAAEVMKPMLMQSKRINTTLRDNYQPMLSFFAKEGISLSEDQKQELELSFQKDFGRIRNEYLGRFLMKEDGVSLDAVWEELCQEYPEFFDSEARGEEQVMQVLDAIDAVQPRLKNYVGYDLEKTAIELGLTMYKDMFYQLAKKDRAFEAVHKGMQKELSENRKEHKASFNRDLAILRRRAYKINREWDAIQTDKRYIMEEVAYARAETKSNLRNKERERTEKKKHRESIKRNAATLIRWMEKPNARYHVPDSLKKDVLGVMKNIDFISSRANAYSKESLIWRERMNRIGAMLEQYQLGASEEITMDVDPELKKKIEALCKRTGEMDKISDMELKDLKELDEIVNSIRKCITEANELRANERTRKLEELGNASLSELGSMESEKNRGPAAKALLNLVKWDLTDPVFYFERMGPTAQTIFNELAEGNNEKIRLIDKAEVFNKELLKDLDIRKLEKEALTLTLRGKQVRMTRAQLMELYELSKRPQGRKHLLSGGFELKTFQDGRRTVEHKETFKLTEKDLSTIQNALTAKERDILDKMRKYLSEEAAVWGNKVTQKLYEVDKYIESNYWPIKTSENFRKSTNTEDDAKFNSSMYAAVNKGFTHDLEPESKLPICVRGVFTTYFEHIGEMAEYSAMALPVMDAVKWYNYGVHEAEENPLGLNNVPVNYNSVKGQMWRVYGEEAKKYFRHYMNDLSGMNADMGTNLMLDRFIRNYKMTAVAANIRVAIQQPTAIARAAAILDVRYVKNAFRKTDEVSGREKAQKYCPLASYKSKGFFDTNIGPSLETQISGQGTFKEKVAEKALAFPGWMDDVTWGGIWNWCEAQTKAKTKLSGEELYKQTAKLMEEVCMKTQVVDATICKCPALRSKSGFVKAEMAFMAEPVKTVNLITNILFSPNLSRSEKVPKIAKAAAAIVASNILNTVAQAFIDAGRDDDDSKKYLERFGESVLDNLVDNLNPAAYLPYTKDFMSAFKGYSSSRMETEAIYELVEGLEKVKKYATNPEYRKNHSIYQSFYPLFSALSHLSGIPVGNFLRDLKTAVNMISRLTTGRNLVETRTVTYTDKYARLLKAYEEGDRKTAQNLEAWLFEHGKTEEDIEAGVERQRKKKNK